MIHAITLSRKSIFCLIVCLLIGVLIFSSCSKAYDEKEYLQNKKVTIEVIDGTVTSSGASFLTTNNSGKTIIYGAGFVLQIRKQNRWQNLSPLAEKIEWKAYAIEVLPGSDCIYKINWSSMYNKLGAGEYRILIPYSIESNPEDPNEYYMICEFRIN